MAFAEAGVDWFASHSQDLYQIQQMGYWPREVVKKAFSIVLNVDNETSAIKALVREATREYWSFAYKQVDRPKWYHNLIADLKLAYPEIAPNFFRARGLHYMCKEGEIALLVIKECLQRKIPVLTLHDSYIMPSKYSVPVTGIVKSAFEKVIGVNCVVRWRLLCALVNKAFCYNWDIKNCIREDSWRELQNKVCLVSQFTQPSSISWIPSPNPKPLLCREGCIQTTCWLNDEDILVMFPCLMTSQLTSERLSNASDKLLWGIKNFVNLN